MLNFCEYCNIACKDERCPVCGQKKLRAVNNDDFCLAAKVDRGFGEDLKEYLERENIECILMPHGTGVRSYAALPLESYLLYVRYRYLDYVRQIVKK